MEQLQKIKNLLLLFLVCTSLSIVSCRTDLVYGTRGNKVQRNYYSDYLIKNLQKFSTQKHQKLVKGRRSILYHDFMRPYKHNGRTTRQRMHRYSDD